MAHIEQAASAGFVDLHTHGIGGLDTESTDSGTMLGIAKAHGLAGVAEIVLSLYPAPIEIMRKRMAAVEAAMRRNLRGQARIAGVHLEGPFLNPAACGALDPALFLGPDEAVYRRLTEGYEGIVRIVTVAPELPGAPGLIRRMARAGIRVNMGHSEATYSEAEAGFRAGARGITHLFNAMRPFHHRAPGIAGFGLPQGCLRRGHRRPRPSPQEDPGPRFSGEGPEEDHPGLRFGQGDAAAGARPEERSPRTEERAASRGVYDPA